MKLNLNPIFLSLMKHPKHEFDLLENKCKRSFMAYSYVAALTGLATHIMFPDDFVRPRVGSDVTLKIHVVSFTDVLWVEGSPEHRFRRWSV